MHIIIRLVLGERGQEGLRAVSGRGVRELHKLHYLSGGGRVGKKDDKAKYLLNQKEACQLSLTCTLTWLGGGSLLEPPPLDSWR